MKRQPRLRLWCLATFAAALLGACGGKKADAFALTCERKNNVAPAGLHACSMKVPGKYYVGAILPYSGQLSTSASTLERSILQALLDVNEQGGIHGSCLGLVVCDSETLSEQSTIVMNELVEVTPMHGVIVTTDEDALVVAPIAKDKKMLVIGGASSSPLITNLDDDGYVFRTAVSNEIQARVAAQVAINSGTKNVFVVNSGDLYGQGLQVPFAEALTASRGHSDFFSYTPGQNGFDGKAAAALVTAQASAVFLATSAHDAALIIRAAIAQNLHPTWLLSDTGYNSELYQSVANAAYTDGFRGTVAQRTTWALQQRYLDRYRGLWNEDPIDPTGPQFYDAMYLIAGALELDAASGSTRETLRNLMSASTQRGTRVNVGEWTQLLALVASGATSFDYVGASGDVDFDPHGDVSGNIEEWLLSGGKLQISNCFTPAGTACAGR